MNIILQIFFFDLYVFLNQRFATELAANSGRVNEINTLANKLIGSDHAHSTTVKRRKKEVNDRYDTFLWFQKSAFLRQSTP